eukprot:484155_1
MVVVLLKNTDDCQHVWVSKADDTFVSVDEYKSVRGTDLKEDNTDFLDETHVKISHYFGYRQAHPELTGRRRQQSKSSRSGRPKKFDPKSWQAPVFLADRKLRSYQVEGVKCLCNNWHQRCNCILADKMTKEDKVVVLVGTVNNDVRISYIPALRICARRFTEP